MTMGNGVVSGGGDDSNRPAATRSNHVGHSTERRRCTGRQVEETGRTAPDDLEDESDGIRHVEVIASLLAVAEQRDPLLAESLAEEPVRPIRIVGVAGTINRSEA